MGMNFGPVIHVNSLDEAMYHYAEARIKRLPLPTFTTTRVVWPTFVEDANVSYSIEHESDGYKYHWSGVMIRVTERTAIGA